MIQTFIRRDDLYKQIGLEDFASVEMVKAEYKKRALVHHPDRGGNAEDMKALNQIYESLTKYKAEYDGYLRSLKAPALDWMQMMAQAQSQGMRNMQQPQTATGSQTVWWTFTA